MNHILIADDEESIGSLLRATLEGPESRITHAATGPEALLLVQQHKFDLIILDWMMPGKSGIDVLRELRQRPETAAIPIIMLTARGQMKDQELALRLGAVGYLMKPFSPLELLEKVSKILSAQKERKESPVAASEAQGKQVTLQ